jgi:radical SAM-linked protein
MRVQLLFQKTESMRYTSHLDLQRALERNFRRAELPLAYSQGYNPRPRIVLASPLPLGFTSLGEVAEAWLSETLPTDELISRLNQSAPPGLNFLSAEPIPDGTPKLPNRLQSAIYQASFEKTTGDLSDLVSNLLTAETLLRERKGKPYDLRPLIEGLEVENSNESGATLLMRLSARPGATGRPDEVLSALGLSPLTAKLQRLEIILS